MRETGDFVRVKNAKLFFLGRKDSQIKRHGKRFSIEYVQQVSAHIHRVEDAPIKRNTLLPSEVGICLVSDDF